MRPRTCTVPESETLTTLAARQHGVVAGWQLSAVGITPSMTKTRMARGHLLRVHRNVYAVGHRQLRREGFWLAAVLAVGPGAVLSHRDAAGLHGLRPANRERVDVTTTRRGVRGLPGIDVHRTAVLADEDVTVVDGVPVTTVERTLVDLAWLLTPDGLMKVLGEADRRRIADMRAIEDALRRTRNRPGPGHATLTAVLAEHRRRGMQLTRSVLEDAFLRLVETHGLSRPRTNHFVEGLEVDAVWPDERVAVELDGWAHHHDRRAFQRDREKANALTEAGWRVLRFTHDHVARRPEAVAERIRRVLRTAAA